MINYFFKNSTNGMLQITFCVSFQAFSLPAVWLQNDFNSISHYYLRIIQEHFQPKIGRFSGESYLQKNESTPAWAWKALFF